MALSPVAAPIMTIQALDSADAGRWQFWVIMSCWCLLAWAFAGAMYWAGAAVVRPPAGPDARDEPGRPAIEPPRLVPVGAGCQNEGRSNPRSRHSRHGSRDRTGGCAMITPRIDKALTELAEAVADLSVDEDADVHYDLFAGASLD